MRNVEQLLAELKRIQREAGDTTDVDAELERLGYVNKAAHRGGSRFVGEGAHRDVVEHVAAGGAIGPGGEFTKAGPPAGTVRGREGGGTLAETMTKALAEGTPSAGGVLVPVEVAQSIVTLIRARTAVLKLNPTVVRVEKQLDIPAFASGTAAQYTAENARLPVSEPTFSITPTLKPLELGVMVPVSNRLLRDAATSPPLEQALRSDMADAMAVRQDLAFLEGIGGGTEPLGIRNQSGMTAAPNLGANGATPTFDNLKDLVANLRAISAPFGRPGWIFHPRTINTLEKVKDTTNRYLADAGLLTFDATGGTGTLLGYKFVTSGQIPTDLTRGTSTDASYIIFSSDWNECWVGENLALEIEASTEATYSTDGGTTHQSAFQQRQTVFRAVSAHDIALRRPKLFTVMEGVRP